jgi:hypothetical protein
MDKKDITYMVAAFCFILIIAFVIKPIVTGQPVNTGISLATPTTTIPPELFYENTTGTLTTIPTPTPSTPVPTWNKTVQNVGFVNPEAYHISTNQTISQSTRINSTSADMNMTVYATITGKDSGTTQIIYIPFPYWQIQYTIDPMMGPMSGLPAIQSTEITPTLGQEVAHSGVQGSYASVTPVFTIQVMDASDPNRIVRTITPPGGIDVDLWEGVSPTTPEVTRKPKYAETVATPTPSNTDPRPWTEKFYEGQRSYYFVINSQYINSYKITILAPTRYIGKY